jgi:glutathione S-transferase
VKLDSGCASYCNTIKAIVPMQEWIDTANAESNEVVEFDVEF